MGRPLLWLLALLALSPAAVSTAARFVPAALAADAATQTFLARAHSALKFEAAAAQLALKKTRNDAVQGFAHQMNLDASAASMKLRQTIDDAHLPAPRDQLDAAHKALYDQLHGTPPGKPFAKAFPDLIDKPLRDDLALFETYAQEGDDPRLKYFASEIAPILKIQLEQLAKLRGVK